MEETLSLLQIACDMRHKYMEISKNINIELNQAREQLSKNPSLAQQLETDIQQIEKQSSDVQLHIKLLTSNVVDLAKELVGVAKYQ